MNCMFNPKIKSLLHRTGLARKYGRLMSIDLRVPRLLYELLPYEGYTAPGNEEPLLYIGLKEAADKAQWHFDNDDPNIAFSHARDKCLEVLGELLQTLKDTGHAG